MRPIDEKELRSVLLGRIEEIEDERIRKGIVIAICEARQMTTLNLDNLRPKGRWVLGTVPPGYFTPGGNRPWCCSECGEAASWMLDPPGENFCSHCGADMRGDTE